MAKTPLREIDVARPVVAWLQDEGWEVYQEVTMPGGGEADVVGVLHLPGRAHPLIRIVEVKTTFSLRVVEQAVNHVVHGAAHFVSVAVPAAERGNLLWAPGKSVLRDVMRLHGIGLLTVQVNAHSWIPDAYKVSGASELPGRLIRWAGRLGGDRSVWLATLRKSSEMIANHVERNPAGSPTLGKMSPYRETMDAIRDFIARRGEVTIDEIVRGVHHHYTNDRGARNTIPGRLLRVEDWCEAVRRDGKTYFRLRSNASEAAHKIRHAPHHHDQDPLPSAEAKEAA